MSETLTCLGFSGALLRREGLNSSNLTQWRKQREREELEGLSRKRGPLPKGKNPLADKVRVLQRENARLKAGAERADGLVERQVIPVVAGLHGNGVGRSVSR